MNRLLTILLVLLGASACLARAGTPPKTSEWIDLRIAEGRQHLAAGQLDAALAAFREADAVELPEAPNYRALPYLAEVHCRSSRTEEGLSILDDVACMIRVDRGELPCFVGPPTSGAPGSDNPDLTDACRERMCGELFLPYYEDPDPERLRELDGLEAETARIRQLCPAAGGSSQLPGATGGP